MITVLGSINLDQIGKVQRLPGPGETVLGTSFATAPGGKGANQALAARRAGANVHLAGAVGDDVFAAQALELLTSAGVNLEYVHHRPGATGIAMILVDQRGENAIAVLPGANASLGPNEAARACERLGRGDMVLLQQEIPQAATRAALALSRQHGATSILNTAPFLDSTPEVADLADVVIANQTEFALLRGGDTSDLEAAIAERARLKAQTVIVTLGADGVRAATPDRSFFVPALRIEPVDTVGAGDTFCGYFAASLGDGLDLERAIERAAAAASLACLSPGAQPAIPLADAVAKAMADQG